jgi:hypothetical protein
MSQPRQVRGGFGLRLAVALMGLFLVAGACSSDSDTETKATPEDKRTTAAEVATGLAKIDTSAKAVAAQAGTDKAKAEEASGQIEPVWEEIEGTIKANDQDSYLAFEDNFALLENAAKTGDTAKAATGAAGVSEAMTDYLARYPG